MLDRRTEPTHKTVRGWEGMLEGPAAIPRTDEIRARATADGHEVLVTADRLVVGSHDHLVLDVAISGLRRIQLDIERDRPATLVIVPMHPCDEPQVIVVQPEECEAITQALTYVGQRMHSIAGVRRDAG